MIVEDILNWVMEVLQESETALPITGLKERLNRKFHTNLDKLDVLLTLDKRFTRDDHGDWMLVELHMSDESLFKLVNQVLTLRGQAENALLAERSSVEDQLKQARNRLLEVNNNLEQLGYKTSGSRITETDDGGAEEYSLEFHLQGLPKNAYELAVRVHEAILGLHGTQVKFNKFHIAYSSGKRYALIIPRKSKVIVLISAKNNFDDPKKLTRDATARKLGLNKIFEIAKPEEIEYGMHLITQSYKAAGRDRT